MDGFGLKRHRVRGVPSPLHLHRTDRSRVRFISGRTQCMVFEQLVAMRAQVEIGLSSRRRPRPLGFLFGAAHLHGLCRDRRLHVHVRQRLLALLGLLHQAELLVLGQLRLDLLGLLGLGLLGLRLLAARTRAAPAIIPPKRTSVNRRSDPANSSTERNVCRTCRPWSLCARCRRRQVPPIP